MGNNILKTYIPHPKQKQIHEKFTLKAKQKVISKLEQHNSFTTKLCYNLQGFQRAIQVKYLRGTTESRMFH